MMKVYCKNCKRYRNNNKDGEICFVPLAWEDYYEVHAKRHRYPMDLNKDNNCPFYSERQSLWQRIAFWEKALWIPYGKKKRG